MLLVLLGGLGDLPLLGSSGGLGGFFGCGDSSLALLLSLDIGLLLSILSGLLLLLSGILGGLDAGSFLSSLVLFSGSILGFFSC